MSNCYRLLQVTNLVIGAVPANTLMPLGITTRKIQRQNTCTPTFELTTSVNNSVYINEQGFYKITYQGYLTVAEAGDIVLQLQLNGATVSTATLTVAAAGTYLVTIAFVTRVLPNCIGNPSNNPVLLQILNSGIALTGGTSNLIIERVSN